jgi:hypothetical protein
LTERFTGLAGNSLASLFLLRCLRRAHFITLQRNEMEQQLSLQIVLIAPPSGVDFGLQKGKGYDYQTIQKQRSSGKDVGFEFVVIVKDNRDDGLLNSLGTLTQGPPTGRFVYINIGKSAGQFDSCWDRRIKVPLSGITWDMIHQLSADSKLVLEAHLPGTAKDGGPSCATVHPIEGWKVRSQLK